MARDFCQSCGMPMDKDPGGGATLADGTRSAEYCSFCMQDGDFVYSGTDARAFQAYVVDQMVTEGWSRPLAWVMTRQIPRLKRWQA